MNAPDPRAAELRAVRAVIQYDLRAIRHLAGQVAGVVSTWRDAPPPIEVAGVALAIHHIYTAAEHTFAKIAEVVDRRQFRGEAWHRELLDSMHDPVPGVRDAVLSDEAFRGLHELRGFRQLVRHAYEYELDAQRVRQLALRLPAVCAALERDLTRFAAELDRRIAVLEGGGCDAAPPLTPSRVAQARRAYRSPARKPRARRPQATTEISS